MTVIIIITAAIFLLMLFYYNSQRAIATRITIGRLYQMLESFAIIDNTVNFKTLYERIKFISELAQNLPKNVDLKICASFAMSEYKKNYPKQMISPTYYLLMKQPYIAYHDVFQDEAYTAFYLRSCEKFKEEIHTLKTSAAKQRRMTNALELSEKIINKLISMNKQKYIDCINQACADVAASIS